MEQYITARTDLIVGVGSGVIQDLCKYVNFRHNLPYHIVATAPSMDGYASVGAAMIWKNMKVTFTCHAPEVITGIVRNKPYLMHGTDVVCSAVYTQQLREVLQKQRQIPTKREFDEKNRRRISAVFMVLHPMV